MISKVDQYSNKQIKDEKKSMQSKTKETQNTSKKKDHVRNYLRNKDLLHELVLWWSKYIFSDPMPIV